MIRGKKRRRNALAIKLELIDAVGEALKKHGFAKLGLNLIAKEAEMDNTAVYRHFKDIEALLSEYIEKQDYRLMILKEYGKEEIEDKRAFVKSIFREQFTSLYNSAEFQQLMIWELGDKDELTSSIAIKRELLAKGLIEQSKTLLDEHGINFNFICALFMAGIYYLILHKDKSTFCHLDLDDNTDREEFIRTIDWLIDLLFDKKENINEVERIAIDAHKEGVELSIIAKITRLPIERIQELIA